MIADELAIALADEHIRPGDKVLDPFCGSGRLLVAAARNPGCFVGVDANPLACLLTMAKAANADPRIVSDLLGRIDRARSFFVPAASTFQLRENRRVLWFSPSVLTELAQILAWINSFKLAKPELLVVAAALSAATRDASYCRKNGWKLHRMSAERRTALSASAWDCLAKRLQYCAAELAHSAPPTGVIQVVHGDARKLCGPRSDIAKSSSFDLVLTSPPYGDSKTTVQYGAASALCLEVVSNLSGLDHIFETGHKIDAMCIGGSASRKEAQTLLSGVRRYWAGSRSSQQAKAVAHFLADLGEILLGLASCLKPSGKAILVLGRRFTGGYRLKLDLFATDCLEAAGMQLASCERRQLRYKRVPTVINRFGRARSEQLKAKGRVQTISQEIILVLKKPVLRK